MSDTTIQVITTEKPDDTKSALPKLGRENNITVIDVDTTVLSNNLTIFLNKFEPVLEKQPKTVGGFQIDEIELSLSINAEGGIEMIGKINAGAEAGIKLKLKRM